MRSKDRMNEEIVEEVNRVAHHSHRRNPAITEDNPKLSAGEDAPKSEEQNKRPRADREMIINQDENHNPR